MATKAIKEFGIKITADVKEAENGIKQLENSFDEFAKKNYSAKHIQTAVDKFTKEFDNLKTTITNDITDINDKLTTLGTATGNTKSVDDLASNIEKQINAIKLQIKTLNEVFTNGVFVGDLKTSIDSATEAIHELSTALLTVKNVDFSKIDFGKINQQPIDDITQMRKELIEAITALKTGLAENKISIGDDIWGDIDFLDRIEGLDKEVQKKLSSLFLGVTSAIRNTSSKANPSLVLAQELGRSQDIIYRYSETLKDAINKSKEEIAEATEGATEETVKKNKLNNAEIKVRYTISKDSIEDAKVVDEIFNKINTNVTKVIQDKLDKHPLRIPIGYSTELTEDDERKIDYNTDGSEQKAIDKRLLKEIKLEVNAFDKEKVLKDIDKNIKELNLDLAKPGAPKIKVQIEADVNPESVQEQALDIEEEIERRQAIKAEIGETGFAITGGRINIGDIGGIAKDETLERIYNELIKLTGGIARPVTLDADGSKIVITNATMNNTTTPPPTSGSDPNENTNNPKAWAETIKKFDFAKYIGYNKHGSTVSAKAMQIANGNELLGQRIDELITRWIPDMKYVESLVFKYGKTRGTKEQALERLRKTDVYKQESTSLKGYALYGNGQKLNEFQQSLEAAISKDFDAAQSLIDSTNEKYSKILSGEAKTVKSVGVEFENYEDAIKSLRKRQEEWSKSTDPYIKEWYAKEYGNGLLSAKPITSNEKGGKTRWVINDASVELQAKEIALNKLNSNYARDMKNATSATDKAKIQSEYNASKKAIEASNVVTKAMASLIADVRQSELQKGINRIKSGRTERRYSVATLQAELRSQTKSNISDRGIGKTLFEELHMNPAQDLKGSYNKKQIYDYMNYALFGDMDISSVVTEAVEQQKKAKNRAKENGEKIKTKTLDEIYTDVFNSFRNNTTTLHSVQNASQVIRNIEELVKAESTVNYNNFKDIVDGLVKEKGELEDIVSLKNEINSGEPLSDESAEKIAKTEYAIEDQNKLLELKAKILAEINDQVNITDAAELQKSEETINGYKEEIKNLKRRTDYTNLYAEAVERLEQIETVKTKRNGATYLTGLLPEARKLLDKTMSYSRDRMQNILNGSGFGFNGSLTKTRYNKDIQNYRRISSEIFDLQNRASYNALLPGEENDLARKKESRNNLLLRIAAYEQLHKESDEVVANAKLIEEIESNILSIEQKEVSEKTKYNNLPLESDAAKSAYERRINGVVKLAGNEKEIYNFNSFDNEGKTGEWYKQVVDNIYKPNQYENKSLDELKQAKEDYEKLLEESNKYIKSIDDNKDQIQKDIEATVNAKFESMVDEAKTFYDKTVARLQKIEETEGRDSVRYKRQLSKVDGAKYKLDSLTGANAPSREKADNFQAQIDKLKTRNNLNVIVARTKAMLKSDSTDETTRSYIEQLKKDIPTYRTVVKEYDSLIEKINEIETKGIQSPEDQQSLDEFKNQAKEYESQIINLGKSISSSYSYIRKIDNEDSDSFRQTTKELIDETKLLQEAKEKLFELEHTTLPRKGTSQKRSELNNEISLVQQEISYREDNIKNLQTKLSDSFDLSEIKEYEKTAISIFDNEKKIDELERYRLQSLPVKDLSEEYIAAIREYDNALDNDLESEANRLGKIIALFREVIRDRNLTVEYGGDAGNRYITGLRGHKSVKDKLLEEFTQDANSKYINAKEISTIATKELSIIANAIEIETERVNAEEAIRNTDVSASRAAAESRRSSSIAEQDAIIKANQDILDSTDKAAKRQENAHQKTINQLKAEVELKEQALQQAIAENEQVERKSKLVQFNFSSVSKKTILKSLEGRREDVLKNVTDRYKNLFEINNKISDAYQTIHNLKFDYKGREKKNYDLGKVKELENKIPLLEAKRNEIQNQFKSIKEIEQVLNETTNTIKTEGITDNNREAVFSNLTELLQDDLKTDRLSRKTDTINRAREILDQRENEVREQFKASFDRQKELLEILDKTDSGKQISELEARKSELEQELSKRANIYNTYSRKLKKIKDIKTRQSTGKEVSKDDLEYLRQNPDLEESEWAYVRNTNEKNAELKGIRARIEALRNQDNDVYKAHLAAKQELKQVETQIAQFDELMGNITQLYNSVGSDKNAKKTAWQKRSVLIDKVFNDKKIAQKFIDADREASSITKQKTTADYQAKDAIEAEKKVKEEALEVAKQELVTAREKLKAEENYENQTEKAAEKRVQLELQREEATKAIMQAETEKSRIQQEYEDEMNRLVVIENKQVAAERAIAEAEKDAAASAEQRVRSMQHINDFNTDKAKEKEKELSQEDINAILKSEKMQRFRTQVPENEYEKQRAEYYANNKQKYKGNWAYHYAGMNQRQADKAKEWFELQRAIANNDNAGIATDDQIKKVHELRAALSTLGLAIDEFSGNIIPKVAPKDYFADPTKYDTNSIVHKALISAEKISETTNTVGVSTIQNISGISTEATLQKILYVISNGKQGSMNFAPSNNPQGEDNSSGNNKGYTFDYKTWKQLGSDINSKDVAKFNLAATKLIENGYKIYYNNEKKNYFAANNKNYTTGNKIIDKTPELISALDINTEALQNNSSVFEDDFGRLMEIAKEEAVENPINTLDQLFANVQQRTGKQIPDIEDLTLDEAEFYSKYYDKPGEKYERLIAHIEKLKATSHDAADSMSQDQQQIGEAANQAALGFQLWLDQYGVKTKSGSDTFSKTSQNLKNIRELLKYIQSLHPDQTIDLDLFSERFNVSKENVEILKEQYGLLRNIKTTETSEARTGAQATAQENEKLKEQEKILRGLKTRWATIQKYATEEKGIESDTANTKRVKEFARKLLDYSKAGGNYKEAFNFTDQELAIVEKHMGYFTGGRTNNPNTRRPIEVVTQNGQQVARQNRDVELLESSLDDVLKKYLEIDNAIIKTTGSTDELLERGFAWSSETGYHTDFTKTGTHTSFRHGDYDNYKSEKGKVDSALHTHPSDVIRISTFNKDTNGGDIVAFYEEWKNGIKTEFIRGLKETLVFDANAFFSEVEKSGHTINEVTGLLESATNTYITEHKLEPQAKQIMTSKEAFLNYIDTILQSSELIEKIFGKGADPAQLLQKAKARISKNSVTDKNNLGYYWSKAFLKSDFGTDDKQMSKILTGLRVNYPDAQSTWRKTLENNAGKIEEYAFNSVLKNLLGSDKTYSNFVQKYTNSVFDSKEWGKYVPQSQSSPAPVPVQPVVANPEQAKEDVKEAATPTEPIEVEVKPVITTDNQTISDIEKEIADLTTYVNSQVQKSSHRKRALLWAGHVKEQQLDPLKQKLNERIEYAKNNNPIEYNQYLQRQRVLRDFASINLGLTTGSGDKIATGRVLNTDEIERYTEDLKLLGYEIKSIETLKGRGFTGVDQTQFVVGKISDEAITDMQLAKQILLDNANELGAQLGAQMGEVGEKAGDELGKKFKDSTEVGSPSPLFIYIGGWIGKSIDMGLAETLPESLKTVEQWKTELVTLLKSGLATNAEFEDFVNKEDLIAKAKEDGTEAGRMFSSAIESIINNKDLYEDTVSYTDAVAYIRGRDLKVHDKEITSLGTKTDDQLRIPITALKDYANQLEITGEVVKKTVPKISKAVQDATNFDVENATESQLRSAVSKYEKALTYRTNDLSVWNSQIEIEGKQYTKIEAIKKRLLDIETERNKRIQEAKQLLINEAKIEVDSVEARKKAIEVATAAGLKLNKVTDVQIEQKNNTMGDISNRYTFNSEGKKYTLAKNYDKNGMIQTSIVEVTRLSDKYTQLKNIINEVIKARKQYADIADYNPTLFGEQSEKVKQAQSLLKQFYNLDINKLINDPTAISRLTNQLAAFTNVAHEITNDSVIANLGKDANLGFEERRNELLKLAETNIQGEQVSKAFSNNFQTLTYQVKTGNDMLQTYILSLDNAGQVTMRMAKEVEASQEKISRAVQYATNFDVANADSKQLRDALRKADAAKLYGDESSVVWEEKREAILNRIHTIENDENKLIEKSLSLMERRNKIVAEERTNSKFIQNLMQKEGINANEILDIITKIDNKTSQIIVKTKNADYISTFTVANGGRKANTQKTTKDSLYKEQRKLIDNVDKVTKKYADFAKLRASMFGSKAGLITEGQEILNKLSTLSLDNLPTDAAQLKEFSDSLQRFLQIATTISSDNLIGTVPEDYDLSSIEARKNFLHDLAVMANETDNDGEFKWANDAKTLTHVINTSNGTLQTWVYTLDEAGNVFRRLKTEIEETTKEAKASKAVTDALNFNVDVADEGQLKAAQRKYNNAVLYGNTEVADAWTSNSTMEKIEKKLLSLEQDRNDEIEKSKQQLRDEVKATDSLVDRYKAAKKMAAELGYELDHIADLTIEATDDDMGRRYTFNSAQGKYSITKTINPNTGEIKTQIKQIEKINQEYTEFEKTLREVEKARNKFGYFSDLNSSMFGNQAEEVSKAKNILKYFEDLDISKLSNETDAIEDLTQKIKDLQTIANKLSPDGIVADFSDKDLSNLDVRKEKLLEVARASVVGTEQEYKFSNNNKNLTYSVKDANNMLKTFNFTLNDTGMVAKKLAGETEYVGAFGRAIKSITGEFSKLARYAMASFSIYRVIGFFRSGLQIVQELDTAMTEMQKVSNDTEDALRSFAKESHKIAQEIGSTAATIQNSAADWMRLGYSINEASELAKNTSILMNVSEFDTIDAATESMVAMIQAFKDANSDVGELSVEIIDKLNNIGNNYSISTSELAESLKRSSGTLIEAGNSIDEAIALTTAGNAIIQDAESTGSALKVISMRIRGTSAKELEDIGEDTEGLIETTSKLEAKVKSLTKVAGNEGISLLDEKGNYRSTYEILQDIANVWEQINEEDQKTGQNRQAALLELLAGKTRAQSLASLLQNAKMLRDVYEDVQHSEGSAAKENEEYLGSIAAHIEIVKGKLQEMWDSAINRKQVNFVVDAAGKLLDILTDAGLVKTLSLMGSVFAGGKLASMNINFKDIFNGINAAQFKTTLNGNDFTFGIKDVELIKKFNMLADSGRDCTKVLNKMSEEARDYATSARHAGTSSSEIIEGFKGINNSARAAAVGAQILNAAINTAIIMALSVAIDYVVKKLNEWIVTNEELKESVDNVMHSFESQYNTASNNLDTWMSISEEYEKLSQGVDNLGNNVKLTSKEFERYNELSNQIAQMSPDLVKGWTNEGVAIISLKNNVDELTNSYINAKKAAYEAMITDSESNNIIEQYRATIEGRADSSFSRWQPGAKDKAKISQMILDSDTPEELIAMLNSEYTSTSPVKSDELQKFIQKELGLQIKSGVVEGETNLFEFKNTINQRDLDNVKNLAKAQVAVYNSEIQSQLNNVQSLADAFLNVYLIDNKEYSKISEEAKEVANIIVRNIDEELANSFDSKESVGAYVASILDELSQGKHGEEIQDAIVGIYNLDLENLSPSEAEEKIDEYLDILNQYIRDKDVLHQIKIALKTDGSSLSQLKQNKKVYTNLIEDITNDMFGSTKQKAWLLGDYDAYNKQYEEIQNLLDKYGVNTKEEAEKFRDAWVNAGYDVYKAVDKYLEQVSDESKQSLNSFLQVEKDGTSRADGIDNYLTKVSNLQQKITGLKNGTINTSAEIANIATEFGVTADSVDELADKLDDLIDDEFKKMNSVLDDYIAEAEEAGDTGLVEELIKIKEACADATLEAKNLQNAFSNQKNLGINIIGLDSGMDQINSIYEDVYNKEGFDFTSIIGNADFYDQFHDYAIEYNQLIDTISDSPNDIKKCQKAFDDLADAYIKSGNALDDLNESNKNHAKTYLETLGVTNAKEMIQAEFTAQQIDNVAQQAKALLEQQQIYEESIRSSNRYKNATEEADEAIRIHRNSIYTEIDALFSECDALNNATEAEKAYYLEKQLTAFDFVSGDIEQLNAIIGVLGLGAEAWTKYYQARMEMADIAAKVESGEMSAWMGKLKTAHLSVMSKADLAQYQKGISDKASSYEIEPPEVAKARKEAAGGAGKDAADAYADAFQEELSNLEWLRDNNFISEKEYLDRFKALYEKYYGDLDKYAKQYYENQRKYLEGMKSLYEKAGNAAIYFLNRQIDQYNDARDKAKEELEAQKKAKQEIVDSINEEIDKINEANDARQKNIDLQKSLYELEKAHHQRNKLVYNEEKGYHYEGDTTAQRDASEDVYQKRLEITIQKKQEELKLIEDEIDAIEKESDAIDEYYDKLIKGVEDYIKKWQDALEEATIRENLDYLDQLGISLNDVLNLSPDVFNKFKTGYFGILNDLDAFRNYPQDIFDPVVAALGGIADKLDDIANSFGGAKTEGDSFKETVEDTEDAVETLGKKFVQFKPDMNEIAGGFTNLPYILKNTIDDTVKELDRLQEGGNANLKLRPVIDAEILRKRGYEAAGDVATVFTHTFNNKAGDIAVNFTPIIADPNTGEFLGVMNPREFQIYAEQVIDGVRSDDLNLQIGMAFEGEDAIQQASEAGEKIHLLHETLMADADAYDKYFVDTLLPDIDTGVSDSVTGMSEGFEELKSNFSDRAEEMSEAADGMSLKLTSAFDAVQHKIQSVISKTSELIGQLKDLASEKFNSLIGKVFVSGTANLGGTAYAGGKWQAGTDSTALVGEEGAEIVAHRNGTFDVVGSNGAQFANIKHDDVVFNAAQTKALLEDGYINSRGKAYAGGTGGTVGYKPLSITDPDKYKMLTTLNSIYADTDKIAYTMIDINKSIDKMCRAIAPSNTTSHVNNAPVINGGIHISCPGITEQEVLEDIAKQLSQNFSGLAMNAYQRSMSNR